MTWQRPINGIGTTFLFVKQLIILLIDFIDGPIKPQPGYCRIQRDSVVAGAEWHIDKWSEHGQRVGHAIGPGENIIIENNYECGRLSLIVRSINVKQGRLIGI